MGFGVMEEYNVGAYDVATNGRLRRSLGCFWAWDVATNGRLRRSHEKCRQLLQFAKNLDNRSKRGKAPRRVTCQRTAPSEPSVCSQLVVDPDTGQAPLVRPVGGIHF